MSLQFVRGGQITTSQPLNTKTHLQHHRQCLWPCALASADDPSAHNSCCCSCFLVFSHTIFVSLPHLQLFLMERDGSISTWCFGSVDLGIPLPCPQQEQIWEHLPETHRAPQEDITIKKTPKTKKPILARD